MGVRTDKAVNNHKSFHTCSGSVLEAFADVIGISEAEAQKISRPFPEDVWANAEQCCQPNMF